MNAVGCLRKWHSSVFRVKKVIPKSSSEDQLVKIAEATSGAFQTERANSVFNVMLKQ